MVEVNYPLPELKTEEPSDVEKSIGKLIAENLVDDGATLQMGKALFNRKKNYVTVSCDEFYLPGFMWQIHLLKKYLPIVL